MGSQNSKQEQEARAQYQLIKALTKKRALLDYQINNLKIRNNYLRLNPGFKIIKELVPYRKTLLSSMEKTKNSMQKVKNRGEKTHSFISSNEIFEGIQEDVKDFNVIYDDVNRLATKNSRLSEKLDELKKNLDKKRKIYQNNKKKIEKSGIVVDLVHGRRKTSEIFQDCKERDGDREISRIDSMSTNGSSRHLKNVSSIPREFCDSDDEFCDRLNSSVTISPSDKSKKLKKFKKFLIFPEKTLFLRSKLILKSDLESTIYNLNDKLLKKYSSAQKRKSNLESAIDALDTDPEQYLKVLDQEISIHKADINSNLCKKDYMHSILSKPESDLIQNPIIQVMEYC